jgi:hypothetical protein
MAYAPPHQERPGAYYEPMESVEVSNIKRAQRNSCVLIAVLIVFAFIFYFVGTLPIMSKAYDDTLDPTRDKFAGKEFTVYAIVDYSPVEIKVSIPKSLHADFFIIEKAKCREYSPTNDPRDIDHENLTLHSTIKKYRSSKFEYKGKLSAGDYILITYPPEYKEGEDEYAIGRFNIHTEISMYPLEPVLPYIFFIFIVGCIGLVCRIIYLQVKKSRISVELPSEGYRVYTERTHPEVAQWSPQPSPIELRQEPREADYGLEYYEPEAMYDRIAERQRRWSQGERERSWTSRRYPPQPPST